MPENAPLKSPLIQVIHSFTRATFTTEDLIRLLAPSAVELKNRGVPADHVYYIVQGDTVSLRTRDPSLGVVWWFKTPGATEVMTLHVKPALTSENFPDFAARAGLGSELDFRQTHPLGDIQHRYRFESEAGRTIEIVVNEIVFSDSNVQVGRVGEIAIKKL